MLAQAWNNGKFLENGNGYGIQLSPRFRDEYLDVDWPSFHLLLEGTGERVELAINNSVFWSRGRELRSRAIGRWLIANGKGRFTPEQPVEIFLSPVEGESRVFLASLQRPAQ